MEAQEAGSERISNEIELIRERAARIGREAGALFRLAEHEERVVLFDRLRNVAGALEVAITYMEVTGERVADMPYEPAPGYPLPPWTSEAGLEVTPPA